MPLKVHWPEDDLKRLRRDTRRRHRLGGAWPELLVFLIIICFIIFLNYWF